MGRENTHEGSHCIVSRVAHDESNVSRVDTKNKQQDFRYWLQFDDFPDVFQKNDNQYEDKLSYKDDSPESG